MKTSLIALQRSCKRIATKHTVAELSEMSCTVVETVGFGIRSPFYRVLGSSAPLSWQHCLQTEFLIRGILYIFKRTKLDDKHRLLNLDQRLCLLFQITWSSE